MKRFLVAASVLAVIATLIVIGQFRIEVATKGNAIGHTDVIDVQPDQADPEASAFDVVATLDMVGKHLRVGPLYEHGHWLDLYLQCEGGGNVQAEAIAIGLRQAARATCDGKLRLVMNITTRTDWQNVEGGPYDVSISINGDVSAARGYVVRSWRSS